MPIIEKISQMQKQGISNEEIVKKLQEEGISPKEISEALDQSKVKSAVESGEEMQPSVMGAPTSEFAPMPYESSFQEGQAPASMEMPEQGALTQEAYPYPVSTQQYQEYEYARADTETTAEIAEQIVAEKMQKTDKQMSEIAAFKTETIGKMSSIDERLRRMESIIDRIQASIIGKIGEYGRNISDLKDEILATQDSFSKILNPLTENIEELRKLTKSEQVKKEAKEEKTPVKQKKKDNFERYLRNSEI